MTHVISSKQTPEERLRNRFHTHLEQDGGNPSQLLEMLELIVNKQLWVEFEMSFPEFVERSYEAGGLGWSIPNLKTVLELRHRFEHELTGHTDLRDRLVTMRRTITDLLTPELGEHGDNQYNESGLDIVKSTDGGNSFDYLIRRLKRDNPKLATRVINGELSAHAAAIEAGIRQPTFQVPKNAESAGAYLATRVDQSWFAEMIDAYYRALPKGE